MNGTTLAAALPSATSEETKRPMAMPVNAVMKLKKKYERRLADIKSEMDDMREVGFGSGM